MAEIEPRPATAADVDAITALVRGAYAKYVPRMGKEPYPMWADYAKAVREEQVWVAEDNGQIIAVLGLISEEGYLMIENIAVAETHQGRGLGRELMKFAEDEARRQGYHETRLYTAEAMTENINIYTRIGYTETERKSVMDIPRVYMSKRLLH